MAVHEHDHGHGHGHELSNVGRLFAIGVALNVVYIVVEIVFGLMANSLALLADAGHNLTDVLGLLLAWGANYLSQRRPTHRYTYGLRSSSILAALLNSLILMAAVGGIVWEAIGRFSGPEDVPAITVMWVAALGVVVNGVTAMLFVAGRKSDLNVQGAFLHMAADAAVSLGVVLAGLGIYLTGRAWIDPLVSLVIAVMIFVSTWDLLRESLDLALQAVPKGIDPQVVTEYLESLPGVHEVHDLHIWAMSTTETALTAHLVKPDANDDDELLARAARELHNRFGIGHTTLQMERASPGHVCRQAASDVV